MCVDFKKLTHLGVTVCTKHQPPGVAFVAERQQGQEEQAKGDRKWHRRGRI